MHGSSPAGLTSTSESVVSLFHRFHIETRPTPDLVPHPSRFIVEVRKLRLVRMVLQELLALRGPGRWRIALSRPCVYGVFSRPVGGLAPRHELCVGCLRCTTQYPDVVAIRPNPARRHWGDDYLVPEFVDTLLYEARTGRVPVRGAGYRGPFGGPGWDGMWTDMSEIVRPTRDGIHGREYISTAVDVGEKPAWLRFDERGAPEGELPRVVTLQVPFLFDPPRAARDERGFSAAVADAAGAIASLALMPSKVARALPAPGPHVAPRVTASDLASPAGFGWVPAVVELDRWERGDFERARDRWPDSLVAVRVPMETDPLPLYEAGVRVLHLVADHHGRAGGRFAMALIRAAHERLVAAGVREEMTLIGSGGVVMAEHVAKAIICGLDVVGLDTALVVALQGRFRGPAVDRDLTVAEFSRFDVAWARQRLMNLANAWRDQLLEVLGAMGLREVRRLRGELGRSMMQTDLEREAFGDIEGFPAAAVQGAGSWS